MFSKRIKQYSFLLLITFLVVEFSFRAGLKLKSLVQYRGSSSSYNLCVVGGSTAMGIPFEEKISIPKLVSFSFGDSLNDKPISVYNLGEAGMPISTAFWNTRELLMGIPEGTMLLYTGINDPYTEDDIVSLTTIKIFQHSWVLSKIYYLMNLWNGTRSHYEYYYEEILKMLQKKSWKVISSTLVGNYSEFAPNILNSEFLNSEYYVNSDVNLPLPYSFIVDSLSIYDEEQYLFYKNGSYYKSINQIDSANNYFMLAIDTENSIRPSSYKNEFIKEISKRYNVPCVNAFESFFDRTGPLLPGYNMFMDAHHPTMEGYLIISDLFVSSLEKLETTKRTNNLLIDEVKASFNLDSKFYSRVHLESAKWHILESFYSLSSDDRLYKAEEYLSKIELSKLEDVTEYNFWYCLTLFLRRDFTSWTAFYTMNSDKINYSYPIHQVNNFERIEDFAKFGIDKSLVSEYLVLDYLSKLN